MNTHQGNIKVRYTVEADINKNRASATASHKSTCYEGTWWSLEDTFN